MQNGVKKNVFYIVLAVILSLFILFGILIFNNGGSRNATAKGEPVLTEGMTLVIDPGHGGEDGGAVAPNGVYESGINLDIALKLDQIMGLYGVKTVLTRSTDDIEYPDNAATTRARKVADQKSRLNLINSTNQAVLISIHQNKYPSGGPFGAQVLYAPTKGSAEFALNMQKLLKTSLNAQNYRTASEIADSIYIMNRVKCPAILVECGFLSNSSESKLLQTDEYRLKIAVTLAAGYLSSADALKAGCSG